MPFIGERLTMLLFLTFLPRLQFSTAQFPSLSPHAYNRSNLVYFFYFTFFPFLQNFLHLLWLTIKKNKREKRDANSKGISRWSAKAYHFYTWFTITTKVSIRNCSNFLLDFFGIACFSPRRCKRFFDAKRMWQ